MPLSCGSIIKKLNFNVHPVHNYDFKVLCWYICPPRCLAEDQSERSRTAAQGYLTESQMFQNHEVPTTMKITTLLARLIILPDDGSSMFLRNFYQTHRVTSRHEDSTPHAKERACYLSEQFRTTHCREYADL
jgi:hypothetical protein